MRLSNHNPALYYYLIEVDSLFIEFGGHLGICIHSSQPESCQFSNIPT